MVPYVVRAVVAVTEMHVLFFVLHVCYCETGVRGYGNAGVRSVGDECVYRWYTWFRCFC